MGHGITVYGAGGGHGIKIENTTHKINITGNTNRPGADNALVEFDGRWNNTQVAYITLSTGDDTTNKDDGRIGFFTKPSGGTIARRVLIQPSGNVEFNNDIDVDGHTNLDNVSIAGVTTMSGNLSLETTYPRIFLKDTNNNPDFSIINNDGNLGFRDDTNGEYRLQILGTGETKVYHNLIVDKDLDVDGHTNLDNVSIAGITTFSDDVNFTTQNGNNIVVDKSDNSLKVGDNIIAKFGDNSGNGDLWIYHDTGHSYIRRYGAGNLRLTTSSGKIQFQKHGADTLAEFNVDGSIDLYYDNTKRFETTSTGINVI
ncbi:MAG: hypothetical protein VXY93_12250, partial [Pseudomonadota bacterium]|nr:hypothetical protein [Pseudomonadota bacterium]